MKGVPVRSGKDVGADHISIDEVVSSMDRTPEDYRSLYYRWETERWDTGAADLSGDRRAWSELAPDRRALFAWLLSRLRLDCETTILVSFADAVPAEEQQVFMTTQIVDEARRAVFLGRYTSEVTGDAAGNGPREALDATLRAVSERLRTSKHADVLAEAAAIYHLLYLGAVLPARLRFFVGCLEDEHLLPVLRRGLTSLAMDAARHVAFGVRLMRDLAGSDPRAGEIAGRALHDAAAGGALKSTFPERKAAHLEGGLPFGPRDLETFAETQLFARCRLAGVRAPDRTRR